MEKKNNKKEKWKKKKCQKQRRGYHTLLIKRSCSSARFAIFTACLEIIALVWTACFDKISLVFTTFYKTQNDLDEKTHQSNIKNQRWKERMMKMARKEEKIDLGSVGDPLPNDLPEGIGSIIKSLFVWIVVWHLPLLVRIGVWHLSLSFLPWIFFCLPSSRFFSTRFLEATGRATIHQICSNGLWAIIIIDLECLWWGPPSHSVLAVHLVDGCLIDDMKMDIWTPHAKYVRLVLWSFSPSP